jgi:hypothetical protein
MGCVAPGGEKRQCMYHVTMSRVRGNVVAVEQYYYVFWGCICSLYASSMQYACAILSCHLWFVRLYKKFHIFSWMSRFKKNWHKTVRFRKFFTFFYKIYIYHFTFYIYHPDVFLLTRITSFIISHTHQIQYNAIKRQGYMFRPSMVVFRPYWELVQGLIKDISCALGSHTEHISPRKYTTMLK